MIPDHTIDDPERSANRAALIAFRPMLASDN